MEKICSVCLEKKDLEKDFYKKHDTKDGRQRHCKECDNKKTKKYVADNAEKVKTRKARYHETHKDHALEQMALYRETNRAQIREKQREYHKANRDIRNAGTRQYRKENADKVKQWNRQYSARKNNLPFERYNDWDIYYKFNGVCQLCLQLIDPTISRRNMQGFSVDHIIPLSSPNCPGDVVSNVQAAHLICNIKKGCKDGQAVYCV